jgi:hypothetical protein
MIKYKINKGLIQQKLGDKTVIFDGEESLLYTFNETASFIFQKLKLGWDEIKIIDGLVKKYQIKEKRAERDFNELVSDLVKKKIISVLKSTRKSK